MLQEIAITGFRLDTMTPENHPENTLEKAKIFFPDKWWISAGTAILLYRDGDWFSPMCDIDIGVDTPEVIEIPTLTEFRRTYWNGRIIQQAFKDDNDIVLDIFHYYPDVKEGKYVSLSDRGYIVKPYFETKELETKYGKLPFPHPIEDYLSDRYGDWKTPSGDKGKHQKELE